VSTARTVPAPEAIALSPDGKNAYVTSEGRGRPVAVRDQPCDRQDHPPCHRPPSPRRPTAHSAWRSPACLTGAGLN
jgi:sugar lactone lactonase YvrE